MNPDEEQKKQDAEDFAFLLWRETGEWSKTLVESERFRKIVAKGRRETPNGFMGESS